jgi:membrane protease YdiL (CAAX protease family)
MDRYLTRRAAGPLFGVVLLVLAYLSVRAFWSLSEGAGASFDNPAVEGAAKLALWGAVSVVATMAVLRSGPRVSLRALGLEHGLAGAGLMLLATTPMAVLAIAGFRGARLDFAIGDAFLGPLAEELLFRGFLFGLLVQVARWRLSTAIVFSAVSFSLAHDGNLAQSVALAAGGAVMAWLVHRWRSLWPAIALHGAMNLWWDFSTSRRVISTSFDPMSVAQIATIILALAITALRTKRKS